MRLFERPSTVDELEALLERERDAILAGDLAQLPVLARAKQRLLERLAKETIPAAHLEALGRIGARNQALLEAARQGIASARACLERIGSASRPMRVYGHDGTTAAMPSPGRKSDVNHRA